MMLIRGDEFMEKEKTVRKRKKKKVIKQREGKYKQLEQGNCSNYEIGKNSCR